MLNWLLIFVPVTIGLEFLAPESHTLIFLAACLAIIPLAGWLGRATEELAHHTGEGIGGLLCAVKGFDGCRRRCRSPRRDRGLRARAENRRRREQDTGN